MRDMLFKWNLQEIKLARVHPTACRPPHVPCLRHGNTEMLGAHKRVTEHRLAYAGFSLISYTALRGTCVAFLQRAFCFFIIFPSFPIPLNLLSAAFINPLCHPCDLPLSIFAAASFRKIFTASAKNLAKVTFRAFFHIL